MAQSQKGGLYIYIYGSPSKGHLKNSENTVIECTHFITVLEHPLFCTLFCMVQRIYVCSVSWHMAAVVSLLCFHVAVEPFVGVSTDGKDFHNPIGTQCYEDWVMNSVHMRASCNEPPSNILKLSQTILLQVHYSVEHVFCWYHWLVGWLVGWGHWIVFWQSRGVTIPNITCFLISKMRP